MHGEVTGISPLELGMLIIRGLLPVVKDFNNDFQLMPLGFQPQGHNYPTTIYRKT